MPTLTQHTGVLDMTLPNDFNHASQAAPVSSSQYSWNTTSAYLIHAYSILDDITFNGTAPLGGTVNAIDVVSGGILQYDVAGLSASLVSITAGANQETYLRAVLQGATTVFITSSFIGAGDFLGVGVAGAESVTGAADTFELSGNALVNVSGDAKFIGKDGTVAGGKDSFLLQDSGSGLTVNGDTESVQGGLDGGDDIVTFDSLTLSGTIVRGDAMLVSSDPSSIVLQQVSGGNDTINVLQSGNALFLVGDFQQVMSTVVTRMLTGGNDTIDARNSGPNLSVYGDVFRIDTGNNLTAGDDLIWGSTANGSFLYGDGTTLSNPVVDCGDDTITGGIGNDTIYGDLQVIEGNPILTGGHDVLRGGRGDDTIQGQVGNDTVEGGYGDDSLNGGNGAGEVNMVVFDVLPAAVFVDLAAGIARGQGADTLAFFTNVRGSNLSDTIGGDAGNNNLAGLDGDDIVAGRTGNDTLTGGEGNDSLVGGTGDDRLTGNAGADTMAGGADNDLYVNVILAEGDVVVEGSGGGTDTVQSNATFSLATLAEVEHLVLTGSSAINGTGNGLANSITGNSGVNILTGGGGNDTLLGAGGKDQLIGGGGNDTMDGGALADTFRFGTVNTGNDTINNFELALDRFDLTGGQFTNLLEIGGNTRLIHAGGSITITGITGLILDDWNALVLPSGGTAREAAPHPEVEFAHAPSPGDASALGVYPAIDFLLP